MNAFYVVVNILIFIYAIAISSAYLILGVMSILEMRRYMRKNYFVDHQMILSSPLAPGISLIAPTYNEELTIIDNVKSLLSIMYNNYEVVIINDGSKDDTLAKTHALRQTLCDFAVSAKTFTCDNRHVRR